MANDIVKIKISDSIELLIEGLPKDVITPEVQNRAALSLIKHGLPNAGVISAGILGGVRTATLQIGNEFYSLKYSINILKVITAVELFKEATAWIEYHKTRYGLDSDLADDAVEYLRSEFSRGFGDRFSHLPGDPTTDAPPPPKK